MNDIEKFTKISSLLEEAMKEKFLLESQLKDVEMELKKLATELGVKTIDDLVKTIKKEEDELALMNKEIMKKAEEIGIKC